MKKYGLVLGKRMLVLNAKTLGAAMKEINQLLQGPLEMVRTDYQQAVVGLKMKSERAKLDTGKIGPIIQGRFEETGPIQITE